MKSKLAFTLACLLVLFSLSGCLKTLESENEQFITPAPSAELWGQSEPAENQILLEEPGIEMGLDSPSSSSQTEWPEDFKDSLPFHLEGEPIDAPGSEWYSGRELEPDVPVIEEVAVEEVPEEISEDADTVNLPPDDFSYETEVADPIPTFFLNDDFGGFMGFQVRVVQDSETGNLSITGTKWLPGFSGSFLLVLYLNEAEYAVIEIPTMIINQYEYYFELEVNPNEPFPPFMEFSFLTNSNVQYDEFEPYISATTSKWFSNNVRDDQMQEITEELVIPAGWLTLSNFTYVQEQNSWYVQAAWDTEGVEQRNMDILFMDDAGQVLLEIGINPQFHLFEPGGVRWLNASNDSDLSLVRYAAVKLK